MGKDTAKRRRGRPRRYAPGKRPTLTFRVQKALYDDLVKVARAKERSLSEEIEDRLNQLAEAPQLRAEAKALRDAADAQLAANRIQAIRQAGWQIVREAGGKMAVNVSPELLLAEADGILRSGFVDPENIDKSPTEIMIKRVVEEVMEALEKRGVTSRKGAA